MPEFDEEATPDVALSSPEHPDNIEVEDIPVEVDEDDTENELADDADVDALVEGVNTDAPVLVGEGD